METILNSIRDEIKKVSSEEKINVGKLTELIQIYRRVEAYTITSVGQIQPINPLVDPDGFGVFHALPPARNETATLYDGIIKAAQEMYKAQTPDISGTRIMRYIDWYKFINEKLSIHIFDLSGNEIIEDENLAIKSKEIRIKLYERILNDIEKELDKKDKKEIVKERLYEKIMNAVENELENQSISKKETDNTTEELKKEGNENKENI